MAKAFLERLPQLDIPLKAGSISAIHSAQPMVLAMLAEKSFPTHSSPLLIGTPSIASAESLTKELKVWLGSEKVEMLPAWETLPFERISPSITAMGKRLHILKELSNPTGELMAVVAPIRALIQKISPHPIEHLDLVKDQELISRQALIEWLLDHGYRREVQVSARGEMAVRGGIVDVFASAPIATNCNVPLRVEFFGDYIDSMRLFSLADQLATQNISRARIFSAREFLTTATEQKRAKELSRELNWGKEHWEKLAAGEPFEGMESWMVWLVETDKVPSELNSKVQKVWIQKKEMELNANRHNTEEKDLAKALIETWGASDLVDIPRLNADFDRIANEADYLLNDALIETASVLGVQSRAWNATGTAAIKEMKALLSDGYSLIVAAWSENSAKRIRDSLLNEGLDLPIVYGAHTTGGGIHIAPIDQGCVLDSSKLAIITESQLTQKKQTDPPEKIKTESGATLWQGELMPGAYVVHKNHGIGRYVGIEMKRVGNAEGEYIEREYLVIHYRGNDKLYLPAEQIGLLSLHSVGETPRLNSLGGSGWNKTRRKAKAEAEEIARELVELYGERNNVEGHSFLPDGAEHEDLAARFPFLETPDQFEAIKNTIADMEKNVPMDRLIYGDVGFGKTEVAIRAAFKAIADGKQVALLAPTTILANQHYQTFQERYIDFPVRIEMLSRFVSPKQSAQTLKELAKGKVDLVVGTHRLLSKDVKFLDLGLLIIDEEQRFGVRHKEKLKNAHKNVDILTLTATPIPRTLEMSLTGIRDFSIIKTPPLERHPILTHVGSYDHLTVKEAIRRELLREGQVFVVHNRIANISQVARDLAELVPEARIATAHGRMNEVQLEQIVLDFTEKKYDVLVCTTIIESGIDMPLVNTLIVNRVETLGLGQLHQLRGRVGRAGAQAYAYLFTTPEKVITGEAQERLRTIGETTALGSGFQLAMRDLEIRGAGNLLGFGQSGHIASVGYDLYCDLVAEAVKELKGPRSSKTDASNLETQENVPKEVSMDLPVDARLPTDYIAEESLRLDSYKKLFAADLKEIESVEKEWRDRFGPLPNPAQTLLSVARLRTRCGALGITNISVTKPNPESSVAHIGPISYKPTEALYLSEELSYDSQRQKINLVLKDPDNMAEEIYEFLGKLDLGS